MKKFFLSLAILTLSLPAFAQDYASLTSRANRYFKKFQYKKAEQLAEQALQKSIEEFGENSLQEADARLLLAKTLNDQVKPGAKEHLLKGLKIKVEQLGDRHQELPVFYRVYGDFFRQQRKHEKAIEQFQKGLAIALETQGESHPEIIKIKGSLGSTFLNQNQYQKAAEQFQLALDNTDFSDLDKVYIYREMASLYMSPGQTDKAKEYLHKAEKIYKSKKGEPHPYISEVYLSFGRLAMMERNLKEALTNFKKALDIQANTSADLQSSIPYTYNNIGMVYLRQRDFKNAQHYFERGLEKIQDELGKDHSDILMFYGNLALLNSHQGKFDEAISYFQKAIDHNDRTGNNDLTFKVQTYIYIGDLYRNNRKNDQALEFYHKALTVNTKSQQDIPELNFHPPLAEIIDKNLALRALNFKIMGLQQKYQEEKSIGDLESAYQSVVLVDSLIENIKTGYLSNQEARIFHLRSLVLYETAINICYQLFETTQEEQYFEKAFYFSERNKVSSLLTEMAKVSALQFADVPTDLIEKEAALKKSISELEKQIFQLESEKEEQQLVELQDSVFSLKRNYEKLMADLEQFPKFKDLKYNHQISDSKKIQKLLNSKSALISYFIGKESGYVFTISSQSIDFQPIENSTQLTEQVQHFWLATSDQNFIKDSTDIADALFLKNGFSLYQALLEKPFQNISNSVSRLIIVPDGILGFLPFEILQQSSSQIANLDYQSLPYLLKNYEVQYGLSATLLTQQMEKPSLPQQKYGGFAPRYQEALFAENTDGGKSLLANIIQRNGMLDLPHAREEINAASKIWNGDAWLESDASEENFKKIGGDYSLLHLSMHGILDQKNPLYSHLLFASTGDTVEDNKLHAYELYNLRLNAELVVLSACNTGSGTLVWGDGIRHLGRAFTYSGIPSMVMSLWSVPDESTSLIMADFFQNLKNKQSKDLALKNAKLDYLEKTDRLHARPFYWAGFVSSGNRTAIGGKGGWLKWAWWGVGFAFVGVMLFYYGRRLRI